jgi:hypothetical protein
VPIVVVVGATVVGAVVEPGTMMMGARWVVGVGAVVGAAAVVGATVVGGGVVVGGNVVGDGNVVGADVVGGGGAVGATPVVPGALVVGRDTSGREFSGVEGRGAVVWPTEVDGRGSAPSSSPLHAAKAAANTTTTANPRRALPTCPHIDET